MAVKLHEAGYEHARRLIEQGKSVFDERDDWSERQPSAKQENEFVDRNGYAAFGDWHLGVNTDASENTKSRYEFPYGDFTDVYRSALLSAESRAGQYKHEDIREAAARLHALIEEGAHQRR